VKKIFTMGILAALVCLMGACGQEETAAVQEVAGDAAVTAETTAAEGGAAYTCVLSDGTVLYIGGAADRTLSGLGEAAEILEAPSCIHEGTDCIYTYDGYTLITSPDGTGGQILYEFSLLSDAAALQDGLTIGSDKAAVEDAFGTDYTEQFGVLRYALEGADVSVVLDPDNMVSSLVITAQMD